jgi:hypothetical protein
VEGFKSSKRLYVSEALKGKKGIKKVICLQAFAHFLLYEAIVSSL